MKSPHSDFVWIWNPAYFQPCNNTEYRSKMILDIRKCKRILSKEFYRLWTQKSVFNWKEKEKIGYQVIHLIFANKSCNSLGEVNSKGKLNVRQNLPIATPLSTNFGMHYRLKSTRKGVDHLLIQTNRKGESGEYGSVPLTWSIQERLFNNFGPASNKWR